MLPSALFWSRSPNKSGLPQGQEGHHGHKMVTDPGDITDYMDWRESCYRPAAFPKKPGEDTGAAPSGIRSEEVPLPWMHG